MVSYLIAHGRRLKSINIKEDIKIMKAYKFIQRTMFNTQVKYYKNKDNAQYQLEILENLQRRVKAARHAVAAIKEIDLTIEESNKISFED